MVAYGPAVGPCAAGLSFGIPCVLAQCASNAVNALVMRHLAPPVNIGTSSYPNLFLTVLKRRLLAKYQEAMEHQQDSEWRIGKKRAKLHLIDESKKYDWTTYDKAKSFVKREVCCKIPTKARLIQGNWNEITAYEYPEEYVAVSKALQSLNHDTFDHGGINYQFVYAGGMSHDDLSDCFTTWWNEPGRKIIDERDGKNWDSTMQESLLVSEARIYEFLKMKAAAAFYKRSQGVYGKIHCKIGLFKQVIKYFTSWKRLSGDWNTSVGNTIISMIIAFVVLSQLPDHLKPRKVRALFMGDDYLAIYYFDQAVDTLALQLAMNVGESRMGITPERALFTDPLAVTFISLGVWPRFDGGLQFVPQPGKQLRKLFWSAKKLHPNEVPDYQSGIALAFWPVYWGFPLMMQFLKAHYTKPQPKYQYDAYFADKLTKKVRPVNWQAGIVYKYRIPFSATHLELPRVNGMVICSAQVADEMLRVETLDPCQREQALHPLHPP